MSTRIFTKMEQVYIIDNCYKLSMKDIARYLKCSSTPIRRFYKENCIMVSPEQLRLFRVQKKIGKTSFTKEEDSYIKENYLLIPIKQVAKNINRSFTGVMARLIAMGLSVPKHLSFERKAKGMYKKGMSPVNKGKKQEQYMSAEAIERTKKTRFKKGLSPHNTLPVGSEVERKDKSGRTYTLIKVEGEKKLVLKHIHIWEKHNNKKLRKGYNVVFKDGDTSNFKIENLECISDQELMRRNTIHQYPEDIIKSIKILSKLNKTIKDAESNN